MAEETLTNTTPPEPPDDRKRARKNNNNQRRETDGPIHDNGTICTEVHEIASVKSSSEELL